VIAGIIVASFQEFFKSSMEMTQVQIHLVFGPPAAGKTTYARELAARIGAVLLDSDEVTERLIRAGLNLAEMDPDDRDSSAYKSAFREAVYETLFDLAKSHATRLPVVIAGPFTREGGDGEWSRRLAARLGIMPEFHYVWCQPEARKERIRIRGATRDLPKLANWDQYVSTCREIAPVFPHHWIDTSSMQQR
jgi:predicted kinase